jgi:1-acyl-sn-glycerol-3-phosphate acyltransferase
VRTPVIDSYRPLLWLLAKAYFTLSLRGTRHIPKTGPLVIASNHVSYADPVLITIPVRRPLYYMAWNRLFEVPAFGWVIRRLRAFPVEVENADPRATRGAVRLLQAGEAVLIFPEGGRTHDGRLGRFKPGAFRLACYAGAPVLPVTIVGGHEAWPPSRRLPRPGRITIIYHPLEVVPPAGDLKTAARDLSRRVREAIASALPPHQRTLDHDR